MAKTKYGKYFVFNQSSETASHPFGSYDFTHMFDLNDEVIRGANSVSCIWFRALPPDSQTYKPHYHDNDEIHGYFGSNPEDPFDLGGEVEIWIDDEKHIFNKSCLLYIPKRLKHGPFRIRKMERPIFVFYVHSTPKTTGYMVDDPKWSHLPAAPGVRLVDISDYRKLSSTK